VNYCLKELNGYMPVFIEHAIHQKLALKSGKGLYSSSFISVRHFQDIKDILKFATF
jgi:hypothetical protein